MTQTTMTIRQMCVHFDVTARTLRFYEAKELLSPIRQGTRRLFTHRDRARMTLIQRGKRFGFSLEEIRQLIDLYDHGDSQDSQITRACELGRVRLLEFEERRRELDRTIADLKEQIAWGEATLDRLRRTSAA